MSEGTPQLLLTILFLVAALVLVLTGHGQDPLEQTVTAILGVAAGFFFRDALSKKNNADNTPPGGN